MNDPRWDQLAELLIRYSTGTQPADRVLISMVETETFPLARAVHAQAVQAGALPYVEFRSAYLERDLMRLGTAEQIAWIPEIVTYGLVEWADVYLSLRGARNPHEFAGIPASSFVAQRRAMGQISALRTEHTRWVIVRVPGESFAQAAGMSHDEAMDLFFDATLRDWPAEAAAWRALQATFQAAQEVHITGWETDLRFSTAGRSYLSGDGHINMPDGELYTAPVEHSIEGKIAFEFPGIFAGQRIEGICLELSAGQVVRASAASNEALLHQLLDMDQGARCIGEFGIGTNPGIRRFCADHFFDEKIAGTVHLALGRSYSECGGTNRSALHWDIVKDLRTEGAIYLDGRKVFERGAYLL